MPVAYPSSCSPQAWSSASVLLLLRTMLDLNPVDQRRLAVGRTDLGGMADLRIEPVACGGLSYSVHVRDGAAVIEGPPTPS
jgi:glycogen debranching enzyme